MNTMPHEFSDAMYEAAIGLQVECDDTLCRVYWRSLRDFPVQVLVRALGGIVRSTTGTFGRFPSIGSIREYIVAIGSGGSISARAEQAWSAVVSAIARYGGSRTVDFDDHAINAAVASIGGWQALCRSDQDRLEWWQRGFSKAYSQYCRDGYPQELGASLSGYLGSKPVSITTGLSPTRACAAIEAPVAKPVQQLIAGIAERM